jgi:hypothetical protein
LFAYKRESGRLSALTQYSLRGVPVQVAALALLGGGAQAVNGRMRRIKFTG